VGGLRRANTSRMDANAKALRELDRYATPISFWKQPCEAEAEAAVPAKKNNSKQTSSSVCIKSCNLRNFKLLP
jgi:hypothetical protein